MKDSLLAAYDHLAFDLAMEDERCIRMDHTVYNDSSYIDDQTVYAMFPQNNELNPR